MVAPDDAVECLSDNRRWTVAEDYGGECIEKLLADADRVRCFGSIRMGMYG